MLAFVKRQRDGYANVREPISAPPFQRQRSLSAIAMDVPVLGAISAPFNASVS